MTQYNSSPPLSRSVRLSRGICPATIGSARPLWTLIPGARRYWRDAGRYSPSPREETGGVAKHELGSHTAQAEVCRGCASCECVRRVIL